MRRAGIWAVLVTAFTAGSLADGQKVPVRHTQGRAPTPPEIAQRTLASTVYIETRDAQGNPFKLGAGFFIASHQLITNFHVVKDASQIGVRPVTGDGHAARAILQYADAGMDLAVLKCDGFFGNSLGVSSAQRRTGDKVYTVGNPEGLLGTFSEGIISGFRDIDDIRYVQITAPISHGSSGGPIVDEKGEVIGVATASIKDAQNLNLAVALSDDLALALCRIARVSKPGTIAAQGDKPAETTPPAKSYSVQITALIAHQVKLANYTQESSDLGEYYKRYSNPDIVKAADLQWNAHIAIETLDAAHGFLTIYQGISSAGDLTRAAPVVRDHLSNLRSEFTVIVESVDFVLSHAQHPDTIRLARKLRDEILSCQSLLQSITIE